MPDFRPSAEEWAKAKEYFRVNPNAVKMDKWGGDRNPDVTKRTKVSNFSFIQVNGKIYALSNKLCFQHIEGGFGFVKQGLTEDGKPVAIKVEDEALRDEQSDAYQAGIITKLIKGQAVRTDPGMKYEHGKNVKAEGDPRKKQVSSKLYTVMEWGGESLNDLLERGTTLTQKQMIALRACQILQAAHAMNIIHADLKSRNITGTMRGNDIALRLIDFDISSILEPGKTSKIGEGHGTIGFASPEALIGMYSTATDVFALAVMLAFEVGLGDERAQNFHSQYQYQAKLDYDNANPTKPDEFLNSFTDPLKFYQSKGLTMEPDLQKILGGMLSLQYNRRPPLADLIVYLCAKLEQAPDLEDSLKDEVKILKTINQQASTYKAPIVSEARKELPAAAELEKPNLARTKLKEKLALQREKQKAARDHGIVGKPKPVKRS